MVFKSTKVLKLISTLFWLLRFFLTGYSSDFTVKSIFESTIF